MIPQIQVGDFLVVDKFSYGLKNPVGKSTWFETREPKKGEMVAFILSILFAAHQLKCLS